MCVSVSICFSLSPPPPPPPPPPPSGGFSRAPGVNVIEMGGGGGGGGGRKIERGTERVKERLTGRTKGWGETEKKIDKSLIRRVERGCVCVCVCAVETLLI